MRFEFFIKFVMASTRPLCDDLCSRMTLHNLMTWHDRQGGLWPKRLFFVTRFFHRTSTINYICILRDGLVCIFKATRWLSVRTLTHVPYL